MQLDDILYAIAFPNRQARSPLVSVRDQPYESGLIGIVAGNITIPLPRPSVGFIRRWEHLVAICDPGVARADILYLSKISQDFTTGTPLAQYNDVDSTNLLALPLINSFWQRSGVTDGVFVGQTGINPLLVNPEDNMVVFLKLAAPVAQQLSVRGWYKDLPV